MTLLGKKASHFCAAILLVTSSALDARLDFSGDGISELWKLKYPAVLTDLTADADLDGWSNQQEGVSGTDPQDGRSFPKLHLVVGDGGAVEAHWDALGGKEYRLERWVEGDSSWVAVVTMPVQLFDTPLMVNLDDFSAAFYRIAVSDVDFDNDGLTAWEEAQLGWSDLDAESSGQVGRTDFNAAIREIESSGGVVLLDGSVLPQRMPTRAEAVRFLQKATFGPSKDSIVEFCSMGYTGWLEAQFEAAKTLSRGAMFANPLNFNSSLFRNGWWRSANIAEDQLRQRVAYALSQILVVNMQTGNVVGDNVITQANYYDIFIKETFSPYREILEQVTYSPVMGRYLSHLKNRKSDPAISRYPDENFAREIMQLFTVGLWELNPDGTAKYDSDGARIPTYDNGTITEMAKVFTGMSFTRTNNGQVATTFFSLPRGNDYQYPMKVWDEEHEPGVKELINNVVLDGTLTGEEEVQAALDALVTHPNIAPFVSRLLIQRFTSSNPSAEYVARVSAAWSTEEDGSTGHLDRVMEAILLDPETLDMSSQAEFRGKVREPIIRFLSVLRAFGFTSPGGAYQADIAGLNRDLGQFPSLAPTVFNFYLPDFSPAGEFAANGMVSPELELATTTQMILSDNLFHDTADEGHVFLKPDYTDELALAANGAELLDHVSELLTGGELSPSTKSVIFSAIETQTTDLEKVRTAIHLVSQTMECVTLK